MTDASILDRGALGPESPGPGQSEPGLELAKGGPGAGRVPDRPLRLTIVNDYELIVAGLGTMLKPYDDRVAVVEFDVRAEPEQTVDLVLFDTFGQPSLGLPRIRSMVESGRVGAVVVYTWTLSDSGRAAALEAGARGLVAKSLPTARLVEALEAVAAGELIDTGEFRPPGPGRWPGVDWGLTARESETLALLATGMGNRAIAEALYVSENTVRTHLKSVFRKLGVKSRSQAVARALTDASFTLHAVGSDEPLAPPPVQSSES
jgi:DNA-binding NarL/FixJ family response regulator